MTPRPTSARPSAAPTARGLLDRAIRERAGRIEPDKLRIAIEVMERLRSST